MLASRDAQFTSQEKPILTLILLTYFVILLAAHLVLLPVLIGFL